MKESDRRLSELHCSESTQRGLFLRFLPALRPMLSSARMEEFVTEEEEPWYDQQDLEQGKTESPSFPRQPSLQHHWPDSTVSDKGLAPSKRRDRKFDPDTLSELFLKSDF